MAIIIDKPDSGDLHLAQDQYNRLLAEYQQSFMFYSGTPPTFESWAKRQLGIPEVFGSKDNVNV